jgi:hypothetical protein
MLHPAFCIDKIIILFLIFIKACITKKTEYSNIIDIHIYIVSVSSFKRYIIWRNTLKGNYTILEKIATFNKY